MMPMVVMMALTKKMTMFMKMAPLAMMSILHTQVANSAVLVSANLFSANPPVPGDHIFFLFSFFLVFCFCFLQLLLCYAITKVF